MILDAGGSNTKKKCTKERKCSHCRSRRPIWKKRFLGLRICNVMTLIKCPKKLKTEKSNLKLQLKLMILLWTPLTEINLLPNISLHSAHCNTMSPRPWLGITQTLTAEVICTSKISIRNSSLKVKLNSHFQTFCKSKLMRRAREYNKRTPFDNKILFQPTRNLKNFKTKKSEGQHSLKRCLSTTHTKAQLTTATISKFRVKSVLWRDKTSKTRAS